LWVLFFEFLLPPILGCSRISGNSRPGHDLDYNLSLSLISLGGGKTSNEP
jgi:hypothetical protein